MRAAAARRGPEPDLVGAPHRIEDPEQGRQAHQQDGGGVDPADQRDHHGKERRIPPPSPAHGQDGQRQHPPEGRPRHHDGGDPGDVVEDVGREHVRQRRRQPPRPGQAEQPAEDPHPGAGGEEQRAHPEPLADPDRDVELGHHPVVRAHREQEADVLVGDRSRPHVRVPHGDGALDQPARVEVQVLLGIGGDLPGLGEEGRDVADHGQAHPDGHVDRLGAPAGPDVAGRGRADLDGRGDCGGFAHGSAGPAG